MLRRQSRETQAEYSNRGVMKPITRGKRKVTELLPRQWVERFPIVTGQVSPLLSHSILHDGRYGRGAGVGLGLGVRVGLGVGLAGAAARPVNRVIPVLNKSVLVPVIGSIE